MLILVNTPQTLCADTLLRYRTLQRLYADTPLYAQSRGGDASGAFLFSVSRVIMLEPKQGKPSSVESYVTPSPGVGYIHAGAAQDP